MSEYLAHHGIKGQKWGVRRFQNPDGTLTKAGLHRYNKARKKYTDEDRKRALSDASMSRYFYTQSLSEHPSKGYERQHEWYLKQFKKDSKQDTRKFAKTMGINYEAANKLINEYLTAKVITDDEIINRTTF